MAEASPQGASSEFKPHLFGKFFLLQRLAVGGMAEIYRARVPGARIPGEPGGFEKELVVKRILRARAQDQNFIKMLVREAILTRRSTERTILLCTHNLTQAELLADQIAIIRRGQIILQGKPEALKHDLLGPAEFVAHLAAPLRPSSTTAPSRPRPIQAQM